MPITSFARIVSAKVMMIGGHARVVVALELMHDIFSCQESQLELPIAAMPKLLGYAGVGDFGQLPGKTVRLEADMDGRALNLAGPKDGEWLFSSIRQQLGVELVAV